MDIASTSAHVDPRFLPVVGSSVNSQWSFTQSLSSHVQRPPSTCDVPLELRVDRWDAYVDFVIGVNRINGTNGTGFTTYERYDAIVDDIGTILRYSCIEIARENASGSVCVFCVYCLCVYWRVSKVEYWLCSMSKRRNRWRVSNAEYHLCSMS